MYQPQPDNRQQAAGPLNISENERVLSLVGGAALAVFGAVRRGTLGIPAMLAGAGLLYRGLRGSSVLYDLMGRNTAVRTNPGVVSVPHEQGVHVTRSVTINRPVEDLYNFWREPTNFPQVIGFIDSVQVTGENRAHWTVKLPGGLTSEVDVEVYTDVPNEVISWRSLPESQVQNAGSVRFRPAPAGRGTEVQLTVEFVPPGGPLTQALFKLMGEAPAQYFGQYLREFKQVMETGEKATNDGQSSGRATETGR